MCFIQETHFTASQIPRFHDHRYPVAYHSCAADSKTKGASILINRGVLRTLRDRWTDDAGRLLFIKGQIGSQTYSLATLYYSNSAQVQFLEQALQCLQDFTEGILILGGDFNLTLDPTLDSTRGLSSIPFAAFRRIKRNLHAYQLIDTCRALSPAGKDFTHYSPPHGSYSRIDLFFTKHDLHRVTKASIGSIHISDHAPILMELQHEQAHRAPFHWTLNKTLLQDTVTMAEVRSELSHYFTTNTGPEFTPAVVWEAHKPVMQGFFMKHGARFKKDGSID